MLQRFVSRRFFSPVLKPLASAPESILTIDQGSKASLEKTFTKEDLQKFGECIGDTQSKSQLYRTDIVYGTYASSLFTTLFRAHFPQAIYLSQDIKYRAPVIVGQSVTAEITVKGWEREGKKDIRFETRVIDQTNSKVCVEGSAVVRVPYIEIKETQ